MLTNENDLSNTTAYSATQTALLVLLILQIAMLFAMFTRTAPHPPLDIPLFGMGPFLSASIALAAAALMLGAQRTGAGRFMCALVVLFALLTFGPQKWLDPAFPKIWPAVVLAQMAIVTLAYTCVYAQRSKATPKQSKN